MIRLSVCDKRCDTLGMVMLIAISVCVTACTAESDAPATASQFAKEVIKEKYEETDPPSAPPVFRWDFSKANIVHSYSYEQEIRNKTDMGSSFGARSSDMEQEMSAKGALFIKSQGDGTAELALKNMKMSMKMNIGGGKEPKTMEQTAPPVVVQGMKEDGSGSFGNSAQDRLLRMLFPLPSKPIDIGEFVDVPSQMPFNAMGSLLQVKGRSRITLERYVKIGNRTCAQLVVDTDISELNIPPELEGEYECSIKGTSVFYFDIASRSFFSGTIALITQFSIDAPMPQMKISGKEPPNMPKRSKMSMTSDNLIRVEMKK